SFPMVTVFAPPGLRRFKTGLPNAIRPLPWLQKIVPRGNPSQVERMLSLEKSGLEGDIPRPSHKYDRYKRFSFR
ncbi:hypothetical protein, partial [Thermogutta sp.]|uniref:hypothetical protein n=1 Tax=Thermogutta sp. TaxID=1962930 RepID=UPI0025FF741D